MQGFVVVSGLPASGKTTVAAALAEDLGLPSLDKDSFLENLFRAEGVGDTAWRRQLSKRADELFESAARSQHAALLSSWWKHPASTLDSGTPIEWLEASAGVAVEVHCQCNPPTATSRFLQRRRHPGHMDDRWSYEGLLAMLEAQQHLGPLFPAKAIVVNTESRIEVPALLRGIAARLAIR